MLIIHNYIHTTIIQVLYKRVEHILAIDPFAHAQIARVYKAKGQVFEHNSFGVPKIKGPWGSEICLLMLVYKP